jgi:STE24 endopeptidase
MQEKVLDSVIDPEKQEKAKKLARIGRIISICNMAITFIYLFFAVSSGWSVNIRNYVQTVSSSWFLQISLYCIIFFGTISIITYPITFYEGYYLQKKYDLLKQSLTGYLVDEVKSLLLSTLIGIPLIALVYKALAWQGDNWWILVSIGYLVISLIAMVIVPVVIMPMFAKYTPVEDQELLKTLSDLAIKSKTEIKGIFRWGLAEKTAQANAALTGFGRTRRIIISDTMLDNYSSDEIETVLAHEIGHHVNKDIFRMLTLGTLITTISLYCSHLILKETSVMWGLQGLSDFANLPLLLIVLTFISLLVMPVINSYSRHRETQADLYSFKIAGKPMVLAAALQKLANQNLSDASPPKIIEFIFYSHPSINNRVKFAEEYVAKL